MIEKIHFTLKIDCDKRLLNFILIRNSKHQLSRFTNPTSHYGLQITMMTSSNGNIFRVTGPLCGEFTGPGEVPAQRPVTRSFDVFFHLRLNKRLSKQPWGWWFETPAWSLWRHRYGDIHSAPEMLPHATPVASFTKAVDRRLAKRPLKTNWCLASRQLTSVVKEATGRWVTNERDWPALINHVSARHKLSGDPRPRLTYTTWRCHKNFCQWKRSFLWKLCCHCLKGLRQRQIAVVIVSICFVNLDTSITIFTCEPVTIHGWNDAVFFVFFCFLVFFIEIVLWTTGLPH